MTWMSEDEEAKRDLRAYLDAKNELERRFNNKHTDPDDPEYLKLNAKVAQLHRKLPLSTRLFVR